MTRGKTTTLFFMAAVLLAAVAPLGAAAPTDNIKQEPVLSSQVVPAVADAGFTGDFDLPVNPSTQPAPLKWADGDILVTPTATNDGKPAIAHMPNGDLFVVVDDMDSSMFAAYMSTDGGQNWTYQKGFGTGTDSRNPSVTCIETSTGQRWVFVVYEVVTSDILRRVRCFYYDPENPGGSGTFVSVVDDIPWTQPSSELYPRIVSDNIDWSSAWYLYVTYAVATVDYYPVFFTRSIDQGATFSTPTNVTGGSENTAAESKPDISYGNGNLHIAFTKPGWNGASWTRQAWVTTSTNSGSAWNPPVQLTASTYDRSDPAVAAANGSDSAVVAFTGATDANSRIYGSATTDGGTTWGEFSFPYTADTEKGVAITASDATPGRFLAVYWRDYDLRYTWADVATPTGWAGTTLVNQENFASSTYPRAGITVNPSKALADQAAIVWTDFRGPNYDVYFDGPSAVAGLIFADGFESGNTSAWN